jgi:two-component system, NarL family, response regulator LiaR
MQLSIQPKGENDPKKDKIKVMIVDDHALMRDSLRIHLESQPDIKVVGQAGDGEEAVKLASELHPDVIIMDIAMPKMNGLEATRIIKKKDPKVAVLVLTVHDDIEYVLKILEAGAAGYLTKNILGDKLTLAVRLVVDGESVMSDEIINSLLKHALRYPLKTNVPAGSGNVLSAREREIFHLAAKGLSNKQISQQLNLNLRTVKSHLVNIFSKLKVGSRTEAVVVGLRMGLITLDDVN